MVTTPALSRFFTSTPDNCATDALAMAVAPIANNAVPSSCFSLISLSPHAAINAPPPLAHYPISSRQQNDIPWVRPDCSIYIYTRNSSCNHIAGRCLRRRAQLFYDFTRRLVPERIFHELAENNGVGRDFLYAAIEN